MQAHKLTAFRAGAFALVLSTAAIAGPVLAHPGEGGGPDRMLGKMTRHLDLSAEQQSSIATLMAEAREEGAADRERMKEIQAELRTQSGSFDAAATRALTDELGEIKARSTYRMTATRAEVHELLDEEQRSKLEGMQAQRGEHGSKRSKVPAYKAGKHGHRSAEAGES